MIQSEIKKNLRSLSGLLENWGNVKNPNALYSVSFEQNGDNLEYILSESEPLIFYDIDIDRHTIPFGLEKVSKDSLDVQLKLATICGESNTVNGLDPLTKLGINIIVDLIYPGKSNLKEVTCSWHLDKNDSLQNEFSHPTYHISFGGQNMKKHGNSFGKLLLMPTPRIMHPPMEIILSCDFIIKNFYSKKKREKIVEEPGYIELIESAKMKYWKPYGCAFVSKWFDNLEIENLTHSMLIGI